jgi:peptide chain release factor 2
LEQKAANPNIWQDQKKAAKIMRELEQLKGVIEDFLHLESDAEDLQELWSLAQTDKDKSALSEHIQEVQKKAAKQELILLLSGPYDDHNAIVTIRSGAGGVDAQDWAEMLMRMLLRWCERRNMKAIVVDKSVGQEAGIKSAIIEIEGSYAYGNLQGESGVHRLVRLSPFNSDNLRQTSFAQVEVLPAIDDDVEVEINESDLRIDTYRASGAGGQHVNKTDSAVRITHEPTKIVVSCQSERSQLQNKDRAMTVLRAKLHKKMLEEKEREKQQLRGERVSAEWGSQIRSYVLHPYKLVKDHRTGYETAQVDQVLDGDIDVCIDHYLQWKKIQENRQ